MNLKDMKALAEQFRGIADDRVATSKLAHDTKTANSADTALVDLLNRFQGATDGAAVRAISDEVKARTS